MERITRTILLQHREFEIVSVGGRGAESETIDSFGHNDQSSRGTRRFLADPSYLKSYGARQNFRLTGGRS